MMFWWKSEKQKERIRKEEERRRKISVSQLALMEAATTTADAAHHVTMQLKKHLEDSIKQFEAAMQIISDGLIICDETGIIKTLNTAAKNIFASNNLEGKNIKLLFGLLSNFENLENINTAVRQNNEQFAVDVKVEKMTKSDNTIVYLILVRDLTSINEIKKTSKEYEQRYKILFDQCIDGIIILQNNKIMALNESAQKLLKQTNIETIRIPLGHTLELSQIGNEYVLSSAKITWNDLPASLITIKKNSNSLIEVKNKSYVDMIICFDVNYIITFVNEAYCSYYNKSKDMLVGSDIRTSLQEEELATCMLSINSLSKSEPAKRVQLHILHNNKQVLQDWTDTATFYGNKIIEYQRVGKDITDALIKIENKI